MKFMQNIDATFFKHRVVTDLISSSVEISQRDV